MGTEKGEMGKFQPYQAEGRASFKPSTGGMEPKQARYKDAVLMVDLAYSPLSQRGDVERTEIPGFGDSLPFADAMAMILPPGWQFYRDKTLEEKAVPDHISFSGGRAWTEVLRQIGDRYALHFHVDGFDKTVVMSKGRPSAASRARQVAVIPEPVAPKPVVVVGTAAAAPGTGAVAFAAGAKPVAVNAKGFVPTPAPAGAAAAAPGAAPAVAFAAGAKPVPPSSTNPAGAGVPKGASGTAAVSAAPAAPQPLLASVPQAPAKPLPPPTPIWKVSPADRTIREALKSWAKAAGWSFEPEHWAVNVDIPITAQANFSGDFKNATRQLIGTTELSATPLQPCFYSNRVVRVVPINEMCDRMSAR
ncbi:toxin co-regulated pilus biosynthesis Q family protein [Pseudomonas sp. EMN2]|uniref:toxin co-regulated pilus biosynthesis Q family protein n=1 Tax=Pseudomonas sp. EMN2 TaxID=2615212 RepID=UPI00129C0066|nr:toxin co-regulated pilus biosynthesis Q family protein [Pseudomonas sp. EMN2]